METFPAVSDALPLWQTALLDAGIFHGILEFGKNRVINPCRAAFGFCSRGMGICGFKVEGETSFIYPLCHADASPLSGDHVALVFGNQ